MSDIPVRKSCDKTVSQNGKDLLNFCDVYSVAVMNGRCGSDINGSFTYISTQGCSLINCALCSPDLLPFVLALMLKRERSQSICRLVPYSKMTYIVLQDISTPENRTMNDTRDQTITKYDFSGNNRNRCKQNLGYLFTNERTLHFISRNENNTIT